MKHQDKEGKKVMRIKRTAALVCVLLFALFAAGAAAQTRMQVYFAADTLDADAVRSLMELTRAAYPQAEWTAVCQEETGESLRDLILSDRAPQIAVCEPGEAAVWMQEGLLVPLDGRVADQAQMQMQVVSACTWEGQLFMAPLVAHHRQMAVNRRLFEQEHLGYMIDMRDHPVWYPSEMDQIFEEFSLAGMNAMEIWPANAQDCAAVEALIQAIYGGSLLTEDGALCQANNSATLAGLTWLRDRVHQGIIGVAASREQALERFLEGKSAVFIDWSDKETALYGHEARERGLDLLCMPYPTSTGLPIRSFELTGACVLADGGSQAQALGLGAVALWCEDAQAQRIWGDRAIWRDDAIWLPMMNAGGIGPTLRSLLCGMLDAVIGGDMKAEDALRVMEAAAGALQ